MPRTIEAFPQICLIEAWHDWLPQYVHFLPSVESHEQRVQALMQSAFELILPHALCFVEQTVVGVSQVVEQLGAEICLQSHALLEALARYSEDQAVELKVVVEY